MKGKWVSRSIVLAVLVIFCMSFFSCFSMPDLNAPYHVGTKPKEPGFFQGKKAVIFDIAMEEREGASRQDTGGGGLFSLITTGVGIGRVIAYNNSGKKFDETNADTMKKVFNVFGGIIADTWHKAYNAETVQAVYDFGDEKPELMYFYSANAALKEKIAGICVENNAEFAVTIMQQIRHGYMDESLIGGSSVAITHLAGQICVFDKTGNIVVCSELKLPKLGAFQDYGYKLRSNDAESYAQLYSDGFANILTAILALDTPSTSVVIEEQMKGVSLEQLQSTEDVEEEE